MKLVKVLICVALSLSFLIIGIGFAVPNATLNFTGDVSFQHTNLYISNVTTQGNVNIIGYSGTMFTLTADEGATMTVSITNPLNDPHYYLNYIAGDHTLDDVIDQEHIDGFTLSENMVAGAEIASGGTLTFTVAFTAGVEYIIKFNFTTVAPETEYKGMTLKGLDTDGDDVPDVYVVTAYDQSNINVEIPSSVNGVPVVEIAGSAFAEFSKLTTIRIPKSITSIGADAFADKDNSGLLGTLKYEQITFLYEGTYEQWQAIEKDANWDRYIGQGSKIYFIADGTYIEETASNDRWSESPRVWSDPKTGTYSDQ